MDKDGFEDNDQFYEGNVTIDRSEIDFTANFRLRFRSEASSSRDNLLIDDINFFGRREDITSKPSTSLVPTLSIMPTFVPSDSPSRIPTQSPFKTEEVTITFDDFEDGIGNYEAGPINAGLFDAENDEQHTPGGSSVLKIKGRKKTTDPDNAASFYHKQDHDVSSYLDVRVNFFFLSPSYDRGDSFVLEASSDSGQNWIEVERWTMDKDGFEDNDQFYEGNVTIDRSEIDFTANFRLRFRSEASSSRDNLLIDDINFFGRREDITSKPSTSLVPTLSIMPTSSAFPTQKPSISSYPTKYPSVSPSQSPTKEVEGPFQMKLWWGEDYHWQGERKERRWCIRCKSSSCSEGSEVIFSECKRKSTSQWWIKSHRKIMPHKRKNHCLSYTGGVKIKKCDENSDDQEWFFDYNGFNTDGERFEAHPINEVGECLSTQHHPRNGEAVKLVECVKAREDYTTSFWNALAPPRWNGH